MNDHPNNQNNNKNHGKEIGDIVQSAFSSGDLSRLKDLGPAVQDAVQDVVKDIPGTVFEVRKDGNLPAAQPGHKHKHANQPQYQQPHQQPGQPYQQPAWYGGAPVYGAPRKMAGANRGLASVVVGVLGMVTFGLCSLLFSGLGLLLPLQAVFAPLAIVCGAAFVASGLLTGTGVNKRRQAKRLLRYRLLFDKKQVYTFPELAAETGYSPKRIRKDLRQAKELRLMEDIWFDDGLTCVMKGEEAHRLYIETEKNRQQQEQEEAERKRRMMDPATAGIEAFKSEGEETVRKIRAANKVLTGEVISNKLDKLEATTERIFSYVAQHPEKLPDTRKFMSYYLPTTLKLVEKYQQYEAMDYQPDNVKQAKKQIEDTMDTIDTAFNNLLESLFQHDTLDVTTDIDVLQQMLEQEGLTNKQFTVTNDEIKLQ